MMFKHRNRTPKTWQKTRLLLSAPRKDVEENRDDLVYWWSTLEGVSFDGFQPRDFDEIFSDFLNLRRRGF
jgi:hypothetical protein